MCCMKISCASFQNENESYRLDSKPHHPPTIWALGGLEPKLNCCVRICNFILCQVFLGLAEAWSWEALSRVEALGSADQAKKSKPQTSLLNEIEATDEKGSKYSGLKEKEKPSSHPSPRFSICKKCELYACVCVCAR